MNSPLVVQVPVAPGGGNIITMVEYSGDIGWEIHPGHAAFTAGWLTTEKHAAWRYH